MTDSLKRKRGDSYSSEEEEIVIKRRKLESGLEETIKYYENIIPGSEEWKIGRQAFDLGGSDIAAAINISKRKTPQKLWREKKGIDEPENLDNNPFVQWGIENEENARWEFTTSFMLTDYPGWTICQPGITVYKEDPRYAVSLDNLMFDAEDPDNPDKRMVIEYKCPTQHYAFIPLEYMVQIQVQMEFANANSGYFYVWRPDISVYTEVPRNKKCFDEFIYPRMKEFSRMLKREEYTPARSPNGEKDRLRAKFMSYFPTFYGDRTTEA